MAAKVATVITQPTTQPTTEPMTSKKKELDNRGKLIASERRDTIYKEQKIKNIKTMCKYTQASNIRDDKYKECISILEKTTKHSIDINQLFDDYMNVSKNFQLKSLEYAYSQLCICILNSISENYKFKYAEKLREKTYQIYINDIKPETTKLYTDVLNFYEESEKNLDLALLDLFEKTHYKYKLIVEMIQFIIDDLELTLKYVNILFDGSPEFILAQKLYLMSLISNLEVLYNKHYIELLYYDKMTKIKASMNYKKYSLFANLENVLVYKQLLDDEELAEQTYIKFLESFEDKAIIISDEHLCLIFKLDTDYNKSMKETYTRFKTNERFLTMLAIRHI